MDRLEQERAHRFPSADGRSALARLSKGGDLLEEMTNLVTALDISAGTVQVIGAVSRLVLGYYHQDRQEYETLDLPGHWELASGLGNVSLKDEAPFVHLHVVASGADGRAVGGHAMTGCEIFVGEAYVRALDGPRNPTRLPDEEIGLSLWG